MPEPWLSTEEIAAHLGVTKDTVYSWIADRGMPAHKLGHLWKFHTSEVDEWVRSGVRVSLSRAHPSDPAVHWYTDMSDDGDILVHLAH